MTRQSMFRSTLRIVAVFSALFGIQLAVAAAPWGNFGSSVATYGQNSFCTGNASYFGSVGARTIKSELFVVHGTQSLNGVVTRRYEAIYAINRSLDWWPRIDVGVFNTNDTFMGAVLPFAYNEVYNVPRATPTYDNDRVVVEYDGVGINTAGVCRVRPSP